MDYELLFLKSLALTIVIETCVLVIYFRFVVKLTEVKISKLLFAGFVTSFSTLPYLWFILPVYIDQRIWYVIVGESFAVLVEAVIIGAVLRIKFLKSFLCSLVCNMISFLTGFILNWPS